MNIEVSTGNKINYNYTTHKNIFKISGTNNIVNISPSAKINMLKIEIKGDNNTLIIGESCNLRGHLLLSGSNGNITIEEFSRSVGLYILCSDSCSVHIGRYCLFSRNTEIRTSDSHSVIDLKTLSRTNPDKSIYLGDHIWMGVDSIISKGVHVADDVIIGAKAFVCKDIIEKHVAVAGIPAVIVKTDVTWNRARKSSFLKDEIFHWIK